MSKITELEVARINAYTYLLGEFEVKNIESLKLGTMRKILDDNEVGLRAVDYALSIKTLLTLDPKYMLDRMTDGGLLHHGKNTSPNAFVESQCNALGKLIKPTLNYIKTNLGGGQGDRHGNKSYIELLVICERLDHELLGFAKLLNTLRRGSIFKHCITAKDVRTCIKKNLNVLPKWIINLSVFSESVKFALHHYKCDKPSKARLDGDIGIEYLSKHGINIMPIMGEVFASHEINRDLVSYGRFTRYVIGQFMMEIESIDDLEHKLDILKNDPLKPLDGFNLDRYISSYSSMIGNYNSAK